jgi:antitoxin FitA
VIRNEIGFDSNDGNAYKASAIGGRVVSSLSIRQIDPMMKERLRLRAARNGRSMEAEVRAILKEVLAGPALGSGADLVRSIRRRFAPLGGVELELPARGAGREPPRFDG